MWTLGRGANDAITSCVTGRLSGHRTVELELSIEVHCPWGYAYEEMAVADEQWARIVDMELVPHPGLLWPKAVEADYGMVDGVLRLKARAALAGYVLRRWSVDSTPDHSLDPTNHQLWLANAPTLYGVESAALAPGLVGLQKTAEKASKSAPGKANTS